MTWFKVVLSLGHGCVVLILGHGCAWLGLGFGGRCDILLRRLGVFPRAADGTVFSGKATEGDVGNVDQPGSLFFVDGADEHALGDGGYEAADAFFAAKEGHGAAVGPGGGLYGIIVVQILSFGDVEGAIPGFAAAFHGNKRGPFGACGG